MQIKPQCEKYYRCWENWQLRLVFDEYGVVNANRYRLISQKLLGDKKLNKAETIETSTFMDNPSNLLSPSKMRRDRGEGSGTIHWRTITKNGKDYPQAYYHYEFWNGGDRLVLYHSKDIWKEP
jgi:hypothetical protein